MDKTLGRIAFMAFDPREDDELVWRILSHKERTYWYTAAAAVAAEVRKEWNWIPLEEAPEEVRLYVGMYVLNEWCTATTFRGYAVANGFTHYLPQPEPPPRKDPI